MTTKRISGTFFSFYEVQNDVTDQLFHQISLDLNERHLTNINVSSYVYRIVELNRENFMRVGREVWVGIIERLDTSELSITSNFLGEREIHGEGEEEGPVNHTGFIYDPMTKVFFLHKSIGGINNIRLGVFLRKILKEKNIVPSSRGYELSILPDLEKFDRLRRAPSIKEISFSYKIPENIGALGRNDRSIMGDLLVAQDLDGDVISIKIKGEHLNRNNSIRKMDKLFELFRGDVLSARAVAEHDDVEEVLDLLNDKLSDYIDVNLLRGQKLTESRIMDLIKTIFNNNVEMLDQMLLRNQE